MLQLPGVNSSVAARWKLTAWISNYKGLANMIIGVQDIYINVQDMERAVKFYSGVLGLAVTDADPHFTGLDAGGVRFGLHWTGGAPVPQIAHDAHGSHLGATITFRVQDIAAAKKALHDNEVTILGSSDNPWGKIVVFQDLDGNILKLMEVPS